MKRLTIRRRALQLRLCRSLLWGLMLAAAAVITPVATADTDVEPASSPLIIANSHSWAPLSYVENGEPKGMLIDFWHLYEHYNHQTVAFQLVDWGDSIEAVRSGSASVHAGLLKKPRTGSLSAIY